METLDKALFLIEMAEQLLTKEMQKSKAIGPDRVNRALIELTKVRHELKPEPEPHFVVFDESTKISERFDWKPRKPLDTP